MCPGLKGENSYYPYHIDQLDPSISLLKVLPLEVVVSNHNVISPVASIDNLGCVS
jgi:hypothetical protein